MLINKIIAGNEQAFRFLIGKYRNYLFQTIYSILRNEKDAEDVTQEAFLKIYYALPKYQFQGFKTWITRIAVNLSIDYKRKLARENYEVTESLSGDVAVGSGDSIDFRLIRTEQRKLVRKRLNQLPDNYRDVIYAYYIEEKSYQEIAMEQAVEIKTIETKLYRARKWMRKYWKEEEFR